MAFPRGFPTRLYHSAIHVPPWCESILGLKFEAVPGKQASLEWPECRRRRLNSWVRKIPWTMERLPTQVFVSFPGALDGKESTCNVGDVGSIPGLGRSPRDRKGYPLQYSTLENSMDCISPWGCKESDSSEQLLMAHSRMNQLHYSDEVETKKHLALS